jgi:hypothetical protein
MFQREVYEQLKQTIQTLSKFHAFITYMTDNHRLNFFCLIQYTVVREKLSTVKSSV